MREILIEELETEALEQPTKKNRPAIYIMIIFYFTASFIMRAVFSSLQCEKSFLNDELLKEFFLMVTAGKITGRFIFAKLGKEV